MKDKVCTVKKSDLSCLSIGEDLKVTEITPGLSTSLSSRLYNLGIRPGVILRVRHRHLNGRMMCFDHSGMHLAIRRDQAKCIRGETVENNLGEISERDEHETSAQASEVRA